MNHAQNFHAYSEVDCRLVNVGNENASTSHISAPSISLQTDLQSTPATDGLLVIKLSETGESNKEVEYIHDRDPSLLERLKSQWQATIDPFTRPWQYWLSRIAGISPSSAPSGPAPHAWHDHHSMLAAADAERSRVHVIGMETASRAGSAAAGALEQPRTIAVLGHARQHGICSLAWRPLRGGMLAVGCQGGVMLWDLAGVRPRGGSTGEVARVGRVSCSFFRVRDDVSIEALSWSPDGRLLAASGPGLGGLVVWDVARGAGVMVYARRSYGKILRWSPCGAYVLSAGSVPRFALLETTRWRASYWDNPPNSGNLVGAAWGPPGGWGDGVNPEEHPVLLLGFENLGHLVAVYPVGEPVKLSVMMMPVVLPGLKVEAEDRREGSERTHASHTSSSFDSPLISDMVWDSTGQRLALLLGPQHPKSGSVALYATHGDPLVAGRLLGFAKLGEPQAAGSSNGRFNLPSLSINNSYPPGALLTMRTGTSDFENMPLIFKS